MLHEPAQEAGEDRAAHYKMRLGFYMFVAYGLVYAGFIVINTFRPDWMEMTIFLGLNLAVVYGFGLIVLALVLALIYNQACSKRENAVEQGTASGETGEEGRAE